jgi:hypothetical protein
VFVKFVYWTGAFDFFIGLATWGGTLANPQPGQFVALMTLGMFLCMAAACLMWASKDVVARYPGDLLAGTGAANGNQRGTVCGSQWLLSTLGIFIGFI